MWAPSVVLIASVPLHTRHTPPVNMLPLQRRNFCAKNFVAFLYTMFSYSCSCGLFATMLINHKGWLSTDFHSVASSINVDLRRCDWTAFSLLDCCCCYHSWSSRFFLWCNYCNCVLNLLCNVYNVLTIDSKKVILNQSASSFSFLVFVTFFTAKLYTNALRC